MWLVCNVTACTLCAFIRTATCQSAMHTTACNAYYSVQCILCVCVCVYVRADEYVGGTLVLQQQTSSLASPLVEPHRYGEAARQWLCRQWLCCTVHLHDVFADVFNTLHLFMQGTKCAHVAVTAWRSTCNSEVASPQAQHRILQTVAVLDRTRLG